jgi:hypothetical protein
MRPKGDGLSPTLKVGAAGFAISAIFSLWILYQVDGEITIFTAFGDPSTEISMYAEDRLGEIFHRVNEGHDGKFFFVQANDPWILNPSENAQILDRPIYRSQRMFYPVLASGGGLLGPEAIVWSLLVVNVIAMGIGSWATAGIAQALGGSAWWGLAFALNLGLTSEVNVSGAGVVATASAFVAVYLFYSGRLSWGVAMLTLAALSREVMLVVALGCAVWFWTRHRLRSAVATFFIPLAAVAIWAVYLRLRIDWVSGVEEVQEIGLPFVGLWQATGNWFVDYLDLAAGVLIVGILVSFAVRAIRSRELLGYGFLGFVFLSTLLTEQVWASYYDITRAVAPAITAFVVLVFARPDPESTRPSG